MILRIINSNLLIPHWKKHIDVFSVCHVTKHVEDYILSEVLYLCKGALGCDVYFFGVKKGKKSTL